jgi:hypothetical protein
MGPHRGVTTEGAPPELRADVLDLNEAYVSHFAVHMLDGQTLTHGLNDSPIGLLAWTLKRWKTWSDRRQAADASTQTCALTAPSSRR